MELSFNEMIPGATVRFTVVDGVQYLSIRDLIMVVCEKDNNDAGQIWRRLPDDKKIELQSLCLNFKFPGRGQSEQPVITFPGAIKVMMWLPGENARKFCSKAAEIITRYYAGDKSLLGEIEANAVSEAPINQMARAAVDNDVSRRREMMQLRREEIELEKAEVEVKKTKFELFQNFMNGMEALDPLWQKDSRLIVQCKDYYKNLVLGAAPAITNGDEYGLTISDLAKELGMRKLSHGELCKAGKLAKEFYILKHGKPPLQRKQFVDGVERLVNAYTESDRDILKEAISQL